LQIIIIVVTVFIYLPFLRMDEKVAFASAQKSDAK
ncbi:hypothetical protein ACYYIN_003032, partial [Listeria monocytogenes]